MQALKIKLNSTQDHLKYETEFSKSYPTGCGLRKKIEANMLKLSNEIKIIKEDIKTKKLTGS